MRLDQPVIGAHPAVSGYFLEFIAKDFFQNEFEDGSGLFFVGSPDFSVTGIQKKDKSSLFEAVDFLTDLTVLENEIRLECFFSGEFGGSGVANIFNLDVYSGAASSFAPNTATFENRVSTERIQAVEGESAFVTVDSEEIGVSSLEQSIYYKVLPSDYLVTKRASEGIECVMQGELQIPDSITSNRVDFLRSNANDYLYSERGDAGVDIFNECLLVFDSGVAKDMSVDFRIRTSNGEITISGSGLDFKATSEFNLFFDGLSSSFRGDDFFIFPTGNEFQEFSVKVLLDQNGDREFFYIF